MVERKKIKKNFRIIFYIPKFVLLLSYKNKTLKIMKIEITFWNEVNEKETDSKTIVFNISNDNPMLEEGNCITDILGNDPVYQTANKHFEFWSWQ